MKNVINVGPLWWRITWRLTHPCRCRKPNVVEHYDCPRHRTKTRGWCSRCKHYDLIWTGHETWCGWCGAGPMDAVVAEGAHDTNGTDA